MFKDSHEVPLKVGDTVITIGDGCIYVVKDFVVYDLVTEVLCEDKLSHNFKAFQLRDVMKIS